MSVDYQTANGEAVAPSDYVGAAGTLSFAANDTSETVAVQIKGDRQLEHLERLFLSLIDPSAGAAIETGQATGSIKNDDTRTRFSTRKVRGVIRVRGRLSPAHPGKRMVVTLFRMRNGAWARVAVRRPFLSGTSDINSDGFSDSGFSTRFPRPRRGLCRIVAEVPRGRGSRAEPGREVHPLLGVALARLFSIPGAGGRT